MIFIQSLNSYPLFIQYSIWFVFGLIFGSFANVCTYRIPRKESVVWKRSFCPSCREPIPFYLNIPLLSFILLKGRCRNCSSKISYQYPLVELSLGLLFLFSFIRWGISFDTLRISSLFFLLLSISVIDLKHYLIPNSLSFFGMFFALMSSFLPNSFVDPATSLIGIILSMGTVYLFTDAFYFFTKQSGFGGGDISLLGMIGGFVGWRYAISSLFAGAILGLFFIFLFVLYIKLFKKESLSKNYSWRDGSPLWKKIPFGPFISLSVLIILIFDKNNRSYTFLTITIFPSSSSILTDGSSVISPDMIIVARGVSIYF